MKKKRSANRNYEVGFCRPPEKNQFKKGMSGNPAGRLKRYTLRRSLAIACRVKRTHKGNLRDVLAKNMRQLRAARGLTQEALAIDAGINRTYLSSVERSERNISIDNIQRIAKALAVDAHTLLQE